MRTLPRNRTDEHNLIFWATVDFYGEGLENKQIPEVRQLAIYLMGRKNGIKLTEEQKEDMWCIRTNLKDKLYTDSLIKTPPSTLKFERKVCGKRTT